MLIYLLILVLHVLVCLVLVAVILLQGGRGGLSEALGGAAAQSLFGGRVTTVLTRITAGCAAVFVVTCLSLAYLSTVRGRSVVEQVPLVDPSTMLPVPPVGITPPPVPSTPSESTSAVPEPSVPPPTPVVPSQE